MEFPWTAETVYLNNASTGPIPERTRRVLEEVTAKRTAPHLLPDREIFAAMTEVRGQLARLLNADAEEIALTTSTSYGLSLAAQGLPLKPGDVVLVSQREFPANVYPWLTLQQRGVVVELLPLTAEGWPDEDRMVERLRDPRVRLLAISWVQFSTGYRADLDRLSAACRANGAFLVVDGIQGVGQLPLDLRRTSIDVLACGGQKWLLSPWGSAFVYVRREVQPVIQPAVVGWMSFEGTDDFSKLTEYNTDFRHDARKYEVGTLPYQSFLAMRESLKMILDLDVGRIAARNRILRASLFEAGRRGELRVLSPTDPARDASIVCVAPMGNNATEAYHELRKAQVVCSLREGKIRIAPHCYNTVEEVEKVVGILTGR